MDGFRSENSLILVSSGAPLLACSFQTIIMAIAIRMMRELPEYVTTFLKVSRSFVIALYWPRAHALLIISRKSFPDFNTRVVAPFADDNSEVLRSIRTFSMILESRRISDIFNVTSSNAYIMKFVTISRATISLTESDRAAQSNPS